MITLLCNISDNKLRITLLCGEIIWRYKYICNRNNQVDKIIKQTKLAKGAMLKAIRRQKNIIINE
ncbi:hypothetical protein CTI18_03010 [Prevotella intermedia]|uniref:Uncharacterized protein n=1 Tax=Prevotella intermedia TaxID=28131 RepID=A0A2G8IA94_PREIN|nr:hypothetical protein CTI18_03010 [Prevotella intermedia]